MKNFFVLYHSKARQGYRGKSYYYHDNQSSLHLRYAIFMLGDVSALATSKYSIEKLKLLLSKPKDLWIFHCCGFKIIDSCFNCWDANAGTGSHFQVSMDGENWKNYRHGADKRIDRLFLDHKKNGRNAENWLNEVDNELVLKPSFKIFDITSIYNQKVFNLKSDFGTGVGERKFPENYLKKLTFFNHFKVLI